MHENPKKRLQTSFCWSPTPLTEKLSKIMDTLKEQWGISQSKQIFCAAVLVLPYLEKVAPTKRAMFLKVVECSEKDKDAVRVVF